MSLEQRINILKEAIAASKRCGLTKEVEMLQKHLDTLMSKQVLFLFLWVLEDCPIKQSYTNKITQPPG